MSVLKDWTLPALNPDGTTDAGRVVRIERYEDEIVVHWVCGATRRFTPDRLQAALDNFDTVVALGGNGLMRYHDTDTVGQGYFAHLTDKGGFQANESMDDGYIVAWDAFSAALREAIPRPTGRKLRKS